MRIAVLFGGDSEERDVSTASASQIIAALRKRGHDVLAVDTALGALDLVTEQKVLTGGVPVTPPTLPDLELVRNAGTELHLPAAVADVDLVFLALHGGSGEDGRLQSLLELARIPYTGSGPLGSAMAMDKDISKRLFTMAGILTPDWLMAPTAAEAIDTLGLPMIVKPNAQGSTVGLSLVRAEKDLAAATASAARFGQVMYERFIPGREITVGILDDAALEVGEILLDPQGVFSYADKYQPGAVRETFPADLPPDLYREAQRVALAAHHALKLGGYSRADFRLDPDGRLWLIEMNSLPGMTGTSLLPQSARAAGIEYGELCERISKLAVDKSSVASVGAAHGGSDPGAGSSQPL